MPDVCNTVSTANPCVCMDEGEKKQCFDQEACHCDQKDRQPILSIQGSITSPQHDKPAGHKTPTRRLLRIGMNWRWRPRKRDCLFVGGVPGLSMGMGIDVSQLGGVL